MPDRSARVRFNGALERLTRHIPRTVLNERMLRTKIVCTLGPATSFPERVRALVEGGMNVARINMSHGDHDADGCPALREPTDPGNGCISTRFAGRASPCDHVDEGPERHTELPAQYLKERGVRNRSFLAVELLLDRG